MTRRERLEARAERRAEWASKRAAKSEQASQRARGILKHIPPGQPILVGHHSERGHRRDLARIDRAIGASVEHGKMASHHASKADGLRSQLDASIYSDDGDAIDALEARAQEREAERDRMKAVNKAWKKAGSPAPNDTKAWEQIAESAGVTMRDLERCRMGLARGLVGRPFPSYALTNIGARIRNDRKRIEQVRAQQTRAQRAEEAGGVLIEGTGEYCSVTFEEKPARSVINALKAAGFYWSRGSWNGKRADLPEEVQA